MEYKSDRDRWAHQESTRDPIFLFQVRELVIIDRDGLDESAIADGKVDDDDLLESGRAEKHWRTELVFYSREEAEAHMNSRNVYLEGRSRVICVPCEGKLSGILDFHDNPQMQT